MSSVMRVAEHRIGWAVAFGLMVAAGVVAAIFAVAAERKPLETVARPLAFVDREP